MGNACFFFSAESTLNIIFKPPNKLDSVMPKCCMLPQGKKNITKGLTSEGYVTPLASLIKKVYNQY